MAHKIPFFNTFGVVQEPSVDISLRNLVVQGVYRIHISKLFSKLRPTLPVA